MVSCGRRIVGTAKGFYWRQKFIVIFSKFEKTTTLTTVFNFTRTLGIFHQKKIVFQLLSIIDTIYGNAWGEPALWVTDFSYHWCVVYLFSEGFWDDSSCWMYVLKKVNQVVQRDFNCKLSSWTRGGVAKQGTRMVCLYYVLYWFPSRDRENLQIKYHINWSCFPFYAQLANDILLIKNIISDTPRHI